MASPGKATEIRAAGHCAHRIPWQAELWFAVEERVVEETGEETAEERADPVDPLIGPVICGESGTEGASRVESATSEGAGDDDAKSDDEADAEASVGARRVAVVDSGGKYGQDEEESGDGFEDEAGEDGEVAGEGRRAQRDAFPGFLWNDGFEEKCRGDGTGDLCDPVGHSFDGGDALGDPEADRDGGIEMAAGDMAERANHESNGEAVCKSDAEQADAGTVENSVSAGCAFPEKDERKGADEFGGKLLGRGKHAGASQGKGMTGRSLAEEVERKQRIKNAETGSSSENPERDHQSEADHREHDTQIKVFNKIIIRV